MGAGIAKATLEEVGATFSTIVWLDYQRNSWGETPAEQAEDGPIIYLE